MAVADELRARGAAVSFIGAKGRIEAELVPDAGYEIDLLSVTGIDRKNPLKAALAAGRAGAAMPRARALLRKRRADVVMGGGGFVAGPVGLAAETSGVPLVLTEADSHLGLANRLLAKRAGRICLAFPIPGRDDDRFLVTGRPVPAAVLGADRAKARERFGLSSEEPCLLVMGGSQGARSINDCALAAFTERSGREFAVIHITGKRDFADATARLDRAVNPECYRLLNYEPNLGDCLAACDLVLARSGGSIFELTAVGRPGVLVPYPFATADHQTTNAAWMLRAGAAVVIPDDEIGAERLAREVGGLFADKARLGGMAAASESLGRPDAAERIASEVLAAVGTEGPGW